MCLQRRKPTEEKKIAQDINYAMEEEKKKCQVQEKRDRDGNIEKKIYIYWNNAWHEI